MYECNSYKNHNLIILWHSIIKSMVTTLNEGCKPHLTKSGLHIIIHKCANHTKNEMLNCTEVGTPYMVCYAHFRFNGVHIAILNFIVVTYVTGFTKMCIVHTKI